MAKLTADLGDLDCRCGEGLRNGEKSWVCPKHGPSVCSKPFEIPSAEFRGVPFDNPALLELLKRAKKEKPTKDWRKELKEC